MQSSQARKIIITGANKGIGYAIVEGLFSGETPFHIILTSRDPENGEKAAQNLRERYLQSKSTITVKQLDITNSKSTQSFVEWVEKELGKIDVLVNNAGIYLKQESESKNKDALAIIETNYRYTVSLTEKLLPSLTEDGKIIMISSAYGLLSYQGEAVKKILDDPNLTEEKLEDLVRQLREMYEQDKPNELGFAQDAYLTSKALLNAYTRWVLTKRISGNQQCFTCSPGHCRTAMGGSDAPKSAEEGADTPIYLIRLPWKFNEDLSGKFFRDRLVHAF